MPTNLQNKNSSPIEAKKNIFVKTFRALKPLPKLKPGYRIVECQAHRKQPHYQQFKNFDPFKVKVKKKTPRGSKHTDALNENFVSKAF